MKYISAFLSLFFLIILIASCIAESSAMPAVGFALSYACFKCVFCTSGKPEGLYDPVDFC